DRAGGGTAAGQGGGRGPGRRTVALEVNDVHSLLDLVDENLGIAVVPRHFRHKRPALTALALKDTDEDVYETVALLPPETATSPAARALITLLETGGLATLPEGGHPS
ncbi:LysR substrate-binding domain-containing protein, partial [Streptomyces sp. NPDC048279]|uniref:LysR substrate-binding domain-containing protein n=1 Tax=Streptomyces sp. NPDC048279 TaxID=3154714 RepID=UPI0034495B1B